MLLRISKKIVRVGFALVLNVQYTTTTTNIAFMMIETLIYRVCDQGTSQRTFTMKIQHGCCNVNIFPLQIVKVHT